MLADDKDRRKFIRYNDQSSCEIRINGEVYKGLVVDYSDGLGVIIERASGISKGAVAEIIINRSGEEMRGQAAWVKQIGQDMRVGFKRIGNLKGDLKAFNLADILIGIQQGTKTGILEIASRSTLKRIYIKNGDMIYSTSNSDDDRLGEVLLREGKINVDQFNLASERLLETGEKLGKILVEMGCMTPKELFLAARHQIEEIIIGLFSLDEGTFEFKEASLPSDDLITLRISAANIIYRGMKRVKSFTRVRSMSPSQDAVIMLSQNPLDVFQSITLEQDDRQILYLANGAYPLKTILQISPSPDFETLKVINAFLKIGIIKVRKEGEESAFVSVCDVLNNQDDDIEDDAFLSELERVSAMAKSADYYRFLNIGRNAAPDEVVKAYYRILRRFHPDRHFRFPKHDIKGKLIRIISSAAEANAILSDPDKRREYDSSLPAAADIGAGAAGIVETDVVGDNHDDQAPPMDGDPETHYELGVAYKEMGLLEDAIKEFQIASRDISKKASCSRAIAGCYVELEQFQEALDELKEISSTMAAGDAECLEIKYDMASIYAMKSDYSNALKLYGDIQSHDNGYKDVAEKIEALGSV